MNLKQATFQTLDKYRDGQRFKGIDLAYEVQFLTGKTCYPATPLRHLREYRQRTGRNVINVDKRKSIYKVAG